MLYLVALICPPLALLGCRRPWQAFTALTLYLGGLASGYWGVAIVLIFGCILWAVNAVGDRRAAVVTDRFVRAVKPIRTLSG